jgi:cytoskeletal protein RodZ
MRKTNLLALSVIAAVLLSSAFLSMAAAQVASEGSEPATSTDVASVPEQTIDPDAADKADETRILPSDENATNPDTPVTDDDAILYTTQDDGNSLIAPAPRGEDTNLESAQNSPDYTLPLVAVGTLLAIIVGGVVGVIYYRKQTPKVQTQ